MIKQFNLSIPFIYSLFNNDAKMVYEDENVFLKSSDGISYSMNDKPHLTNYKGHRVAYFTYKQALGHFLSYQEDKINYLYDKNDLLKIDIKKNPSLTCQELSNIKEINDLLNYLLFNELISKEELNRLKIILSLKEDNSQRWFIIKLNDNVQGFMLFIPNSDEIMSLAYHFCINKAILNQLLNYSILHIDNPYINLLNLHLSNLNYQQIPFFFGEYDDRRLAAIYSNLENDEIFLKEIIASSLYSCIKLDENDNSIILKHGNTYFASKNSQIRMINNCIKINNDSEYKLMVQKAIHPLDESLVEVDFNTFFSYVKCIKEYENENYQQDLASVWGMGGHFYLYKDANIVVGGGVIQYETVHYSYCSYIFTLGKYRNKGYGSRLVKAITAINYTITNKLLLLIVLDKNLINFYEKCGFEIVCGVDYS